MFTPNSRQSLSNYKSDVSMYFNAKTKCLLSPTRRVLDSVNLLRHLSEKAQRLCVARVIEKSEPRLQFIVSLSLID